MTLGKTLRLSMLACFVLPACVASSAPEDGVHTSAIVGGSAMTELDEARTPLVYIEMAGDRFCSGTLIGDRVVLTAAHCVEETLRRVLLRFEDGAQVTARSIAPVEVRGHPKHQFGGGQTYAEDLAHIKFDVGLVRLAAPAPASKPRAALLPRDQHDWIRRHIGTPSVNVLGYGATSSLATHNNARRPFRGGGYLGAPNAMTDGVTGLPLDQTLELQNDEALVLDESHGAQMCYGDSGGPLFATEGAGDVLLVVGVSSWVLDSFPGGHRCDRGSVHPAVSHPENADFLRDVLAAWAD